MIKVIIPKTFVDNVSLPLIFLAGPIKSAPDWQDEAIQIFAHFDHLDLTIASPRSGVRNDISQYVLSSNESRFYRQFYRQRVWERYYLDIAAKTGAIMFWLPGEEKHNCEKVYGAMTRIELGQWMTRYKYDNSVRMCVGSDGNFPELDTILYDLSLDMPKLKVKFTLAETCIEALEITFP